MSPWSSPKAQTRTIRDGRGDTTFSTATWTVDRAITKLRDEWMNGEIFYTLKEAKVRIEVGGSFAGHTTFDDGSHFEKGDRIIVDTDGETFASAGRLRPLLEPCTARRGVPAPAPEPGPPRRTSSGIPHRELLGGLSRAAAQTAKELLAAWRRGAFGPGWSRWFRPSGTGRTPTPTCTLCSREEAGRTPGSGSRCRMWTSGPPRSCSATRCWGCFGTAVC